MRRSSGKVLAMMIAVTILFGMSAGALFLLARRSGGAWEMPLAVTLFTFFYHFAMRLAVGEAITLLYRNRPFPTERFDFRLRAFEAKLYKKLKVRRWEKHILTARPEQFDVSNLSPEELLHNVLQAELCHRWIVLLSYLPLLFILPFGEPAVFCVTSVLSSLIDLKYVILQRYHRPLILRHMELSARKERKNRF